MLDLLKKLITAIVAGVLSLLALVTPTATAAPGAGLTAEQQTLLHEYGLDDCPGVVIDSAMTREQALGESVVPSNMHASFKKMEPLLRVVPVVYHGYDHRIHLGQIVVHQELVGDIRGAFYAMFWAGFPVKSVIPESRFGYNDEDSMLANNTSGYRPEKGSEHRRGSAFDINPFDNPMDVTDYSVDPPVRTIDPPTAMYDPNAVGAIRADSAVRLYFRDKFYEWGGNWGNPEAEPPSDFFRKDFFDYQHFQLGFQRYYDFNARLPAGV